MEFRVTLEVLDDGKTVSETSHYEAKVPIEQIREIEADQAAILAKRLEAGSGK